MGAPITHFVQFEVDAKSPEEYRHIIASGVKALDVSSSGALNFGVLNNGSGIVVTTPTKCAIWVIDSMEDATEEVFDMKFWLSSVADFIGLNTDYNAWFNQEMSTVWQSGLSIDQSDGEFTPSSLPSSQNILSSSGTTGISEGGTDEDCSQYIYLSVSVDPNTPVGNYGGDGVGGFRYRMTYKYI